MSQAGIAKKLFLPKESSHFDRKSQAGIAKKLFSPKESSLFDPKGQAGFAEKLPEIYFYRKSQAILTE